LFPAAATAQIDDEGVAIARELSDAFESVAELNRLSVVSVVSTGTVPSPGSRSPFEGSPWEEFFGRDFFERFDPSSNDGQRMRLGQGSGVIVSKDGYVLTNNHVVANAEEVEIVLGDERSFTAEIVGTDPKTDLAVLKIDAPDLVPARLGDSDAMSVGEWVVAAGNPFGLTASVTAGIVSALGRSNMGITDYEDFIQTDAAINPGNSGGPLLNLDGEVVGINTAIMTRSGGSMGVGFAIPSNMARDIMNSLIETGRVVRGWLGVGIQRLTPELANSFDFEGDEGVLVAEVDEGTPAYQGGLRAGDIVVAYDGRPLESMEGFRTDVASTPPGTEVPIEVFRDGERRELRVEVGELETRGQVASRPDEDGIELGIGVQELTPTLAERMGLDDETDGVVVTQVRRGSKAAAAGLRRGDLIAAVQGQEVTSIPELREALDDAQGRGAIRLAVVRGGMRMYVVVSDVG
jgi:serine protease Do